MAPGPGQCRLAEAARLYRVVDKEYGKAQLPPLLDETWADPWELYWPESVRPKVKGGSGYRVGNAVRFRLQVIEESRTRSSRGVPEEQPQQRVKPKAAR